MSIQTFKEKVRGFVSRIPTDKKKHLAAGFAICAIVSLLFGYVIGLIAATIGSTRLYNQEGNARICRFRVHGSRRVYVHSVFCSPFFVGASLHYVGLLLSLALQKASYS